MSAPTPGVFTCAELQVLQLRAQTVFAGGGANLQSSYLPESDAAAQLLRVQTPRFEALQDPAKDRTMKIYWVDSCPQEVEDCPTDYCSIEGAEGGASCIEYEIDRCVSYPAYTVKERFLRTSELTFDEVLAPGYTQMILGVENALSKAVLEFLRDNAGVPEYAGPYTISGDEIQIPPSGWNADMFGYLNTILLKNRLQRGVMLSSEFLQPTWYNVQQSISNPTGAADARKWNAFGQPTFDIFQMADVFGEQALVLYNPDALALVVKSEFLQYGSQGRVINGSNGQYTRRYAVRGINLPIWIDMIYQMDCQGKDIVHTWKPFINYGIFLNPLGCNTDRTGILKLTCAA